MRARSGIHLALIPACTLLALPSSTVAGTFVVHDDGTGDFPNIQVAIDGVQTGDVIELTDGTFTGPGNRDISFLGKAIIVRSQSGNPETCIIDCEGSELEPHRGFNFVSGETAESVLEGVTVTGGWVGDSVCGAGGRCRSGSTPTIVNCRFIGGRAGCGAGFWCQVSDATFIDCVFSGSSSTHDGGGVFFTDSSPTLTRCSILDNEAPSAAAMGLNFAAAPMLIDCVIAGNQSVTGAVIRCEDESAATLTGCTVVDNEDLAGVGTIDARDLSSMTIVRSLIYDNSGGPAIVCNGGSASLSCTNVFGNAGGDWVGCISDQVDVDDNFAVDPELCSATPTLDENFGLQNDSPCAPGNHPQGADCGLIGAAAVGCATTPTERASWGAIKASYR